MSLCKFFIFAQSLFIEEELRIFPNPTDSVQSMSSEFFQMSSPISGEEPGIFPSPRAYMTTHMRALYRGGARDFSRSHRLYIEEELGIFLSRSH